MFITFVKKMILTLNFYGLNQKEVNFTILM
jgi:hypothetical protein